jgi:hypothetical protein
MAENTLPAAENNTSSTETSDLANAQDEGSQKPLSLINSSDLDPERRDSTDSNFSLRPSYKQK